MDRLQRLPEGGWDPRVRVIACGDLVQTFLVVTRRYVVLVDTMIHPASGLELLEMAREVGDGRQLLALNTHADWDHYWGNQVMPCPILASERCRQRVEEEGPAELRRLQSSEPERFAQVVVTAPTLTFAETLRIDGGDLTLEVFPTPGHRPDHVAVWIPEIRTLLAGDAAEVPFPLVDHDLGELRRSLRRMQALQPAWTLACHAPPCPGDRLLRDNLAWFDRLEELCAQASQAVPEADAELPDWLGWPCASEWDALYREGHARAIRATLRAR